MTKRDSVIANVGTASVPVAKTNIVDEWYAYLTDKSRHGHGGKEKDKDEDASPKLEHKAISIFGLLSYSTPREKGLMILGVIMATLSGLGIPAWLILLSMALESFSDIAYLSNLGNQGATLQDLLMNQLNNLVIAFFGVGVLALITGSLYVAIWTYTGEKQSLRIKERFVRSALRQDAGWFDKYNREEIPTMMETSMLQLNDAIGRQMVDTYSFIISAAGCLSVSLVLNAPLTLIMLCVIPVVAIVTMVFGMYGRRASHSATTESARAGALATEVISGIKTVAALCAEHWALDRYGSYSESSRKFSTKSGILSSVMTGITGCLFYLTYMAAFWIGTVQVSENSSLTTFVICLFRDYIDEDTLETINVLFPITGNEKFQPNPNCKVNGAAIMVCIYGVILGVTYVGLMAPGIRALNNGRQAAADVFDTIKRVPEIDSSSADGRVLESVQGRIELQNVTFSYPSTPHNPIFYNMNLLIEPGQSVALVGPSGSGKSTIGRLLLRFYDPSSGNISVDGVPIDELNIQWWRSQIGYVAQDPILFPGTVSENIAVGKPGATPAEIEEAAKSASAHDFIMELPDGYSTYYSGASAQLSGGQLQRINIARAMIRKPSVLLLDEATSALDNKSERQVQVALANIRKAQQVTTVSVSHRLSTIVDCDQIAVIANGAVAEIGKHKELVEQGGIYATLCETQGISADYQVDLSEPPKASPTKPENGADVEAANADKAPDKDESAKEDSMQEVEQASLTQLKRKYGRPYLPQSIVGLAGALIVGALSPCESILTAQIVANFYVGAAPEDIPALNRPWILGFSAFAGAALIGHSLFGYGYSTSGYGLAKLLRAQTFEALIRRPMGFFDVSEHSVGELTKLLSVDIETLADESGFQRGYKLRMITSLVTGVVIALAFSWKIGLVAIACVPLIFGAGILQAACMSRQFVKETDGLPPTTILEQSLRGISAIQAYNLQESAGDDYAESLKPESDAKVKRGSIAGLVYGLSQFSVFASFAIVFLVGSILLSDGQLDFVHFFTPVLAVMFGAFGAAQVSANFSSLQEARAAAARILSVLEEPTYDADPWNNKGEKPDSLTGSISFDKCTFHYPTCPDRQIFYKTAWRDGFCLDVNAKETVAFVGKSGCGKSTAQQIVLRFYDVSGGVVKIDGTEVKDLNAQWLRQQIGYVAQNPVLFSGSVRENILLGCPKATEEEIVAAAKAANAHEFVSSLAEGYDTDIGTGGNRLSGGQKQRLCISRAIVGSPRILVLDEATSALDNESQKIVQAALDNLQKTQPRTTLTVAHRLTTIQHSDNIVVLGDGGVMQQGTHESLLEEGGLYSELWKMQGVSEEEVNIDV